MSARPHLAALCAVRLNQILMPANTSPKTQPCDPGVIKNLKSHYTEESCWLTCWGGMTPIKTWRTSTSQFWILFWSWRKPGMLSLPRLWTTASNIRFSKLGLSHSVVVSGTSEEFQEVDKRKLIEAEIDFDTDWRGRRFSSLWCGFWDTKGISSEEKDDEDDVHSIIDDIVHMKPFQVKFKLRLKFFRHFGYDKFRL